MKTLVLLSAMLLSIGTNFSPSLSINQDNDMVTDFLANTKSFESTEISRPIARFNQLATDKATKQTELTKENMLEVIEEAKSFKYLVITTGNHTIVKITDLENCAQSGSWGACMPFGEGYISRQGNLEFQQDHLNNIIGIPGSQTRMAYFFN